MTGRSFLRWYIDAVAEIPSNPTALGSLVIMPAVIILVSSCANEYTRRAKTSTSDLTVRRLDAMFLQNCLRSCNDFLGENDGLPKDCRFVEAFVSDPRGSFF